MAIAKVNIPWRAAWLLLLKRKGGVVWEVGGSTPGRGGID